MSEQKLTYMQNRELSWLRFNERVLEEAQDAAVPLMERMKFVSIFTSNLDEFFMIRVGSLHDMEEADPKKRDPRSDMTPKEQLEAIYKAVEPLYRRRDLVYEDIKRQLFGYGVYGLDMEELSEQEHKYIRKYFKNYVLPVLSPQIVDPNHPFPHLMNKDLHVIARLKKRGKTLLGIVPVPSFLPAVVNLPDKQLMYVRLEKIIRMYLPLIFDQYQISADNCICVTRNADISPDDEAYADSGDFRRIMKKTLHKRRRLAVVRVESAAPLSSFLQKILCQKLSVTSDKIFTAKAPMKLDFMFQLSDKLPVSLREKLVYDPFAPCRSSDIMPGESVMEHVKKKDLLLSYPYESMEPFLQMIREASCDPDVLSIKITIYRLAKKARLVEYLCAAAENHKDVTVLIELRARFDEQNNIDWSERLEEAGCRVLYGFEGYKVHSKICQITYRCADGVRYITQIGTGNYNEKTAAMYTDYCLITADEAIGEDAALFFKNMAISNLHGAYSRLLVSPDALKQKVLLLMDEEIVKGKQGRIWMKMNSLTDIDFIRKLHSASKAGVDVQLVVRGICCILPGVLDETENIHVTSIVGRFLEHPRVFIFGKGEEARVYIGSADMMTRNTEKRVEVACPVFDPRLRSRLTAHFSLMLEDNVKARAMDRLGQYRKKEASSRMIDAQKELMDRARMAQARLSEGRRTDTRLAAAGSAPGQTPGRRKERGFFGWMMGRIRRRKSGK